ncbi:hypothetical protein HFO88_21170 [Rhizobium leguminosarum]|uniref:hypothetical protein n=1 Tax=Rhizobium leguminosarum TaxID=384 RepID=UPI0015FD26F1|nr:hypothetical protein [Rhizobium leguminosarum]MBA9032645.1 hypothetical protein [Rhizobium leguminosarum]MBY5902842.1 hypothetical protein [Rhizobium leguminosarum]MBY5909885.1 hypothetical protein [Rhizobium leguminosarum]
MSDFGAVMTGTIVTEESVAENYVTVTGGITAAMETGRAPGARRVDFGTYFLTPIELQGHRDERHNFRR